MGFSDFNPESFGKTEVVLPKTGDLFTVTKLEGKARKLALELIQTSVNIDKQTLTLYSKTDKQLNVFGPSTEIRGYLLKLYGVKENILNTVVKLEPPHSLYFWVTDGRFSHEGAYLQDKFMSRNLTGWFLDIIGEELIYSSKRKYSAETRLKYIEYVIQAMQIQKRKFDQKYLTGATSV